MLQAETDSLDQLKGPRSRLRVESLGLTYNSESPWMGAVSMGAVSQGRIFYGSDIDTRQLTVRIPDEGLSDIFPYPLPATFSATFESAERQVLPSPITTAKRFCIIRSNRSILGLVLLGLWYRYLSYRQPV